MLMTTFGRWWRNFDIGDIFWMLGPDANVKRWWLSPHFVSNIRHQHWCNRNLQLDHWLHNACTQNWVHIKNIWKNVMKTTSAESKKKCWHDTSIVLNSELEHHMIQLGNSKIRRKHWIKTYGKFWDLSVYIQSGSKAKLYWDFLKILSKFHNFLIEISYFFVKISRHVFDESSSTLIG